VNNELQWTEKDEQITSEALGIKYIIRLRNNGWCSMITGRLGYWENDAQDAPEYCKNMCQSHHNAICKAVEEAYQKGLSDYRKASGDYDAL